MSHRSIHLIALTTIATVALLLGLTWPERARAGFYDVLSCHDASGGQLPTGDDQYGWQAIRSGTGLGLATMDTCADGGVGALEASLLTGFDHAVNDFAEWRYFPPTGTSISRARIWWSGYAESLGSGLAGDAFAQRSDWNESQFVERHIGDGAFSLHAIDLPDIDIGDFTVAVRCSGSLTGCPSGVDSIAAARINRSVMTIRDIASPQISAVSGSLTQSGALTGLKHLDIEANDVGGGLYRTHTTVDGVEMDSGIIDANGGWCEDADPTNTNAHEFVHPKPCRVSAAGHIALDTGRLVDGTHDLDVAVEDAAGNRTQAFAAKIVTANAPASRVPPNLSGVAHVGDQLVTDRGGWGGNPGLFTYRWLRCDAAGANCAPIPGATHSQYAIVGVDAYHRLVAEVTATNANGSGVVRTVPSDPIADSLGRTKAPGAGSGASGAAGAGSSASAGVANGSPASERATDTLRFDLGHGRTATSVRSVRNRRWTIRGRLVDERGRPIAGARLGIDVKLPGRRWTVRATVRTAANGSYAYVLAHGPSRAVRSTYRAFAQGATRTSNDVSEGVYSPVSFQLDRNHVVGGQPVTLSGHVGGELLPSVGVLVNLQGYQRGWGWRTFRTVRTRRNGTWHTSYLFRLSHGHFAFRAVVPQQGTYPFLTTFTRALPVVVG
jgi:hypothetical protein